MWSEWLNLNLSTHRGSRDLGCIHTSCTSSADAMRRSPKQGSICVPELSGQYLQPTCPREPPHRKISTKTPHRRRRPWWGRRINSSHPPPPPPRDGRGGRGGYPPPPPPRGGRGGGGGSTQAILPPHHRAAAVVGGVDTYVEAARTSWRLLAPLLQW